MMKEKKDMDILEMLANRHSVRSYLDKEIEPEKRQELDTFIKEINEESGLNIQILYDEKKCFSSFLAHYGKFVNVSNYISLSGPKGKQLDEKIGYYGERLLLKANAMGLDTCWVALTHGKSLAKMRKGEKERCLIALGYGVNHGYPHKVKRIEEVSDYEEGMPEWYLLGVKAALMAPTALNQQKFRFEYIDGKVKAKALRGFYSQIDLGIVKYHFELGSGQKAE